MSDADRKIYSIKQACEIEQKAYQQGRADAIDEFCHWYFDMKNDAQINAVDDLIKRFNAEQLKEQINGND